MNRLVLHSEHYAPTGNIGDSGLRKLLGSPAIDNIQTVLREAIQNSCDADKSGLGPEIKIRLRTLTDSQADFMREQILFDLPAESSSAAKINSFKKSQSLRVMEICDFNTTGLGGPTRADQMPEGTQHTDFIDFLRNVGTMRDTSQGGGTYGFGKVSLYLASKCQTILVDSRTDEVSGRERRFMGCHLGAAGSIKGECGLIRRLTGRHWWGVMDGGDDFAEPATNEHADKLARGLGFIERDERRSGTSIMILDPSVADEDISLSAGRLIEGILWNFWPRMMRSTPIEKKLRVNVEVEGKPFSIPEPEDFPPLDHFARAMDAIRSDEADVEVLKCRKPRKDLGRLKVVRGFRAPRTPMVDNNSIFPEHSAHIAVMRPVELVVKYYGGTAIPDSELEWAGVFVASEDAEVEQAFADSEPPAHDDWEPENMPKGQARTFVRRAVAQIKEKANAFAPQLVRPTLGGDNNEMLAAVSSLLGNLLDRQSSSDGGRRKYSGRRIGAARNRNVSRADFVRLEEHDGRRVAIFNADIVGTGPENFLKVFPRLMLDGSAAKMKFADAERSPEVVCIRFGGLLEFGDSLFVNELEGSVEISVAIPEDCAIGIDVQLQTVDVQNG